MPVTPEVVCSAVRALVKGPRERHICSGSAWRWQPVVAGSKHVIQCVIDLSGSLCSHSSFHMMCVRESQSQPVTGASETTWWFDLLYLAVTSSAYENRAWLRCDCLV